MGQPLPSNQLTIVAIPAEYSYAYRMSSEKVPHLTILYIDAADDTQQIIEYIRHVVETSLTKFWLQVDHRGLLGDQDADVLFFDKEHVQLITKVRTYMLSNDKVKSAFDRIEQFPEWTPHLTLGYPKTPAKTSIDPRDEENWVEFDKIGIWTGDYEGVIIDLNAIPVEAVQQDMAANVEDFFAHVGVKGMRWGVRKKSADTTNWSPEARSAHNVRTKSKTTGHKSLTNQEIQSYLLRLNLEKQFKESTPSGQAAKFMKELLLGVGKQNASKLMAESMNAGTKSLSKLKK